MLEGNILGIVRSGRRSAVVELVHVALIVRIVVEILVDVHNISVQAHGFRMPRALVQLALAVDLLYPNVVKLGEHGDSALGTVAFGRNPVDVRRIVGLHIDVHFDVVGRTELTLIYTIGIRTSLPDVHAHITQSLSLHRIGDDDVEDTTVGAETITSRVAREVGLENEAGVVDVNDVLTIASSHTI